MGGKNPFLGIAYVVVGGLCVLLGAIFTATHLIKPRQVSRGSRPKHVAWLTRLTGNSVTTRTYRGTTSNRARQQQLAVASAMETPHDYDEAFPPGCGIPVLFLSSGIRPGSAVECIGIADHGSAGNLELGVSKGTAQYHSDFFYPFAHTSYQLLPSACIWY